MNKPLDHDVLELVRTAPQNVELEQQLLGALLQNNEAFYRVSDFLKIEHFFVEPHRRIYDTLSKLIRSGKVATPLTVKTFFAADETMADLSVTEYLTRLAANATTIINAEDYGRTLFDLSVRRALMSMFCAPASAAFFTMLVSTWCIMLASARSVCTLARSTCHVRLG